MKLISSFMDDIVLSENKLHSIAFQSTNQLHMFRNLLQAYFKNSKAKESEYLLFTDKNNNTIDAKDLFFLEFNCNELNLAESKQTKQSIQSILMHNLMNNPDYVSLYAEFTNQLEQFITAIDLINENISIDFWSSNKTLQSLINSLEIKIINNNEDEIGNRNLRDYLIRSLLEMNVLEKQVFLLVNYPESDLGYDDFSKFISQLEALNVTILIVTTQPMFLTAASDKRMFLIEEYGTIYNIEKLKGELEAFQLVEQDKLEKHVKELAFYDFLGSYHFMTNELKTFFKGN